MLYVFQMTTSAAQTLYNSTPGLVFGGEGSEPGRLREPRGVAVHHLTDMTYVADYGNNRVCEFNSSGHVISCMSGYITDDNIAVYFNHPSDVSVMTDGRMIICDDHRVMLMYRNTTIIHVWGSLTTGHGLGQFKYPEAVASDGDLIYVADHNNERIQVLNVTSIDVIAEIKVHNPYVLYKPHGVAVDPESGYIFVTGYRSGGDIMILYNMTGHYVRKVTASDLGLNQVRLRHIALYKDQVYVSDFSNTVIYRIECTEARSYR